MVVGRLWNFAKRHRKKFIAGGIVAGGAYYAWKVWLPRVQQRLLENLLKEIANDQDLSVKDDKEDKKAKFQHQQRVSDDFARKGLPKYLSRHSRCFNIDGCHVIVKEAKTKDAKLSALGDLQVECLTMVASSLYSLYALLLLHRVQFNIVGREMAVAPVAEGTDVEAAKPEIAAVATEFLEMSDYFLEHGSGVVSDACRKAVQACAAKSSLAPDTAVTADRLTTFFKEVLRSADKELLGDSKGAATLLPPDDEESSGANASGQQQQVKRLLDEARDYAESPQLLEVFRTVTTAAADKVPQQLGSAALQEGGSVTLARLFGNLIGLSKSLLGQDENELSHAEDCIAAFECSPVVNELCEGLYFQTR